MGEFLTNSGLINTFFYINLFELSSKSQYFIRYFVILLFHTAAKHGKVSTFMYKIPFISFITGSCFSVKIEQRLTLFYLANDVIQYSKRKNFNFVESWGTALQKATTMVRYVNDFSFQITWFLPVL